MLTLCRLPPVLLIHLKRFSFKGPFTEKLETVVDFPLNNLDLTNYMPSPLPPGLNKDNKELYGRPQSLQPEDPRRQLPPYKYDLFGVTNHFGTLSNGHCEPSNQWGAFADAIQTLHLYPARGPGNTVTTAGLLVLIRAPLL